jgi:WD40 repeat protein
MVNGVCTVRVTKRELLASAGVDHMVRIWDPATGAPERTVEAHTGWVNGVCAVHVEPLRTTPQHHSDQQLAPGSDSADRRLEALLDNGILRVAVAGW